MSELRLLLEEKLLIRREKREVIQQLPTKMREKVQLDPSLIEHKSKSLVQASQRVDEPHMKASDKRSAVINYFQETCKAKFKAVCQYVADLIESDKKFIVFAHHQIMLDEIEKECQNAGAGYMRIDGSTQSETRQYLGIGHIFIDEIFKPLKILSFESLLKRNGFKPKRNVELPF